MNSGYTQSPTGDTSPLPQEEYFLYWDYSDHRAIIHNGPWMIGDVVLVTSCWADSWKDAKRILQDDVARLSSPRRSWEY